MHDVWNKKEQYGADICEIVYSDFLSGLSRTLVSKQVIPFDIATAPEDESLNRVGDAFTAIFRTSSDCCKSFRAFICGRPCLKSSSIRRLPNMRRA